MPTRSTRLIRSWERWCGRKVSIFSQVPGGSPAAAALHIARTVSRRAERLMVELARHEPVGAPALRYMNRLSDFLFVASRIANRDGHDDILWVPGQNR